MKKNKLRRIVRMLAPIGAVGLCSPGYGQDGSASSNELACQLLIRHPALSINLAEVVPESDTAPVYCYIIGAIPPGIRFHLQLPLPSEWNGRLLHHGDGGPDGDLDFADHRVTQGYAVVNSNAGHDEGSEPGYSFGHDNRQAEIDFGYRAVHVSVNAAKTAVRAFYGRDAAYSYHDGCSTGGRQGLMAAQRYSGDFDGIVAGAPVHDFYAMNAAQVRIQKALFEDDFAGNLAFDNDGDGIAESLTKMDLLQEAVLAQCGALDGITDGVIDNPLVCEFDPATDLAGMVCRDNVNADDCLTAQQIDTINTMYADLTDNRGNKLYPGNALGSEFSWRTRLIPQIENGMSPRLLFHVNGTIAYLFYEDDPGVPVPDPKDLSYVPDRHSYPPEVAWWEFNVDDLSAGLADTMSSIIAATDPDLTRFLINEDSKLILWHGWGDADPHPESTIDYYNAVVDETFEGDLEAARERARLFMVPGMGHCRGGPGPNDWDTLAPVVQWVENGIVPDYLVATHETNGVVDNERRICAYPQQARYVGPLEGANDPENWVQENFACQ